MRKRAKKNEQLKKQANEQTCKRNEKMRKQKKLVERTNKKTVNLLNLRFTQLSKRRMIRSADDLYKF
jgi:hypothetical protein